MLNPTTAIATAATPAITTSAVSSTSASARTLSIAALAWLSVALLGQALFAFYVLVFYGGASWRGQPEQWNEVLPHGYVAGDTWGNIVVALHLAFTVVIVLGGMVQLLPWIRRRWPALHRWNGRLYLLAASVLSLGGLIMIATRGSPDQRWGIVGNALLILICAIMTWRHARARRFDAHRRWAVALFLCVSGVWFFRVGLMLWLAVHGRPVGFDPETFKGPFLSVLSYAQYLLPLALWALYLRAQGARREWPRWAMSAVLVLATAATAVGILAAAKVLWLPHL